MKKLIILILTAAISFSFFGCTPSSTEADGLKIVTSFYPIMLLTKMVTENIDGITVTNLAAPDTGCLHDYSLSTGDMKRLEDADIFVINGLGMESFLDKTASGLPDLRIIDMSKGITPVNDNAHIWLSPKNAQTMIAGLCYELITVMPDKAEQLNANTAKYTNRLIELDSDIQTAAQSFSDKGVITCHEAFDYFASEYKLRIDGVIQREPGDEPTTAELVETTDLIREKGASVLLVEPQYSTTAAETLSRETGAKIYEIDPVVTGQNSDTPEQYFEKMHNNIKVLQEAFAN